ncbi:MAG: two pore domain potassium channel family protein [Planctomycetaceae bacterium]|jgi:voltage-gated potassium channel|nr:two pore domain potassium channel family protein [Planctomycetaceae bacterium]MBT6156136.1 two pore domain potassium channel family protein [Planctomycetaceae bacterium]MBT6486374.1 two pore domain potassium channel family protein [Planctomycetaceae bacterium]MBT6493515.1 two pore domain potassium channel family protein [Planctomycetaceae bacterium]
MPIFERLPFLGQSMQRYRFSILLTMLLALMVFSPCALLIRTRTFPELAPLLVMLLFSAVLLSAVFALARQRWTMILAGSLTGGTIVVQAVNIALQLEWLAMLQNVLGSAMLVFALALLLRALFLQQRVTFENIAASLCGYLLLGVLWANIYSMLDHIEPASFVLPTSALMEIAGRPADLEFGSERTSVALYFSYVTLTTLGYGDITPATTPARMFCSLEAIFGQLYLAVLVARLVGLHIAHQSNREPPQSGTPS